MKSFKTIINEATQARARRLQRASEKAMMNSAISDFDVSDGDTLDFENHPLAKKEEELMDLSSAATQRDVHRVERIADDLKERNPDLYNRYAKEEKPRIIGANQNMIDSISSRLELLRRMKAPDHIVKIEQERLDKIGDRLGQVLHHAVGTAHRKQMETLYKP